MQLYPNTTRHASEDGDTILVKSGTYKENLFIDKQLKISGDGVILQPSVSYAPTVQVISQEDVIIEGLKVTQSSKGIKAINTEDISVFNCTFSQNDCGG